MNSLEINGYTCAYNDSENNCGFRDIDNNNWYDYYCFCLWYTTKICLFTIFRADAAFESYVTNPSIGFHQEYNSLQATARQNKLFWEIYNITQLFGTDQWLISTVSITAGALPTESLNKSVWQLHLSVMRNIGFYSGIFSTIAHLHIFWIVADHFLHPYINATANIFW